ncbi:hypothetical protein EAX61_03995 [Dokdonia sinensis]|uniref:DUF5777 domain-containing protein n=2 Tax=Dokdonia sinensis TaxID=2479847 RepID=A0A3M0GE51_9FLAO|nr:hypothetical protein EAX61_03995 [Dokdonia sinensis]
MGQDLWSILESEPVDTPEYVMSTFKGNRLSIGHSIETRKKGALEVTFMSRYWNTAEESNNNFFADRMCARFGVDYAFSDRFTAGVGYGPPNGIADGYVKYRFLQQGAGGDGSPVGITGLQTATYRSRQLTGVEDRSEFFNRTAFTSQLLIARKINTDFSLQVAPTFVHRSSSSNSLDDHNHFAVGFGGRYKLGNHVSLVSEYYYVANPLESIETFGSFALGVNWDVRYLLLQFTMTNNPIFTEDTFITQTRRNFNFKDGNFFFGFNATYFLQL